MVTHRLRTEISNNCGDPDDEEEAHSCHCGEDLKIKWLRYKNSNYHIEKDTPIK